MKRGAGTLIGLGIAGVGAYYFAKSRKEKPAEPSEEKPSDSSAPAAEAPHPSGLTKEEIEGKREYTHPTPPGFTRNVGVLPPEAGGFARQGLGKPYGAITGPQVLSDGRTYVGVTESHFDDHVTNPRTGQKDKHWHKGVSLFVQA